MTLAHDQRRLVLEEAAQVAAWEREGHHDRCGLHTEDLPRIAQALAAGQTLSEHDAEIRNDLEQCSLCREVLRHTVALLPVVEPAAVVPEASPPARSYGWLAALAALLLAGVVGVVIVLGERSAKNTSSSGQTDAKVQPRRTPMQRRAARTAPAGHLPRLPATDDLRLPPLPAVAAAHYRKRNITGAIRALWMLDDKRYGAHINQLRHLRAKLDTGLEEAPRDPFKAMVDLRLARDHDAALGGAHQAWLKKKLAERCEAHANALFAAGRYEQSFRLVKLATDHAGTRLKPVREKLAEKAQALFNNGYVIRRANPKKAGEYWRRVLNMVPPSNKWSKKALFFLQRYGLPTVQLPKPLKQNAIANGFYQKARTAWLAGDCDKAIKAAQAANQLHFSTRHVSIIGACACSLRREPLARWAFTLLRGGQRNMLMQICRSKGIELP